jgi:hypothetical protein
VSSVVQFDFWASALGQVNEFWRKLAGVEGTTGGAGRYPRRLTG